MSFDRCRHDENAPISTARMGERPRRHAVPHLELFGSARLQWVGLAILPSDGVSILCRWPHLTVPLTLAIRLVTSVPLPAQIALLWLARPRYGLLANPGFPTLSFGSYSLHILDNFIVLYF